MTDSNAQCSRPSSDDATGSQLADDTQDTSCEAEQPESSADEDDDEEQFVDDDEKRFVDDDEEQFVDDDEKRFVDDHLRDVEPGAGCTEIWEYLSERRDE
jgi:hypothetical protein